MNKLTWQHLNTFVEEVQAYPITLRENVKMMAECETIKKLIVVENCIECPYVRNQGESGSGKVALYCTHHSLVTGAKFIISFEDLIQKGFTIPNWCPLEDYID